LVAIAAPDSRLLPRRKPEAEALAEAFMDATRRKKGKKGAIASFMVM
jgi:hypothetical protein